MRITQNCVSSPGGVSEQTRKNLRRDLFVCVEVLRPSQPDGVISSAVSFPHQTFTGQA